MRFFPPVPWRTIPPNLITATAMACGIYSIFLALSGGDHGDAKILGHAAWYVLLSTLLDKADGSVARALKGSSEFGVQFDSFADSVAFGLAPGALVFASAQALAPQTWGPGAHVLGLPAVPLLAVICLLYAIFTSVRLARFNVITAEMGPNLFLGLPSTLSGGLICSAFLTIHELGLESPALYRLFPALLVLNAALMVSNLPLPKLHLSAHPIAKVLQVGAAVAVYVTVLARTGFTFVLALLLGYLAFGFAIQGPRMWRERQQQG